MDNQNNYKITKAYKYKQIYELKDLLKETLGLKGLDINIQASKVLAYIHSDNNKILSDYYVKQVEKYFNLKNTNLKQYKNEEQTEYDSLAQKALKLDNKIILGKYFESEKLFTNAIDFEFKNVITNLSLQIPQDKINEINTECIYDGIFEYYKYISFAALSVINNKPIKTKNLNVISVRTKAQPIPILPKIAEIYDFYYLELKEKQAITSDNKYLSEWVYLKIAIIKVLNSLIDYLNNLGNESTIEIHNNKKTLQATDIDFLKLAIQKKLYNDNTITTQDILIQRMYPDYTPEVENEKKKMRRVCENYNYLIPKEREKEKTLGKFLHIAKQLQELFA